MYYPKYGLPSLFSASGSGVHRSYWAETDANLRSYEYFSAYHGVTSFDPTLGARTSDWNERIYPLASEKTRPSWWEYSILPFCYIPIGILIALINT